MIAVHITAGTGTEVTRNAVLASPEHRVKVSLRSIHMLPSVALVDSELTYKLPKDVTAGSGLDAFVQVLEPLVSNKPNPLVDAFCWDGLAAGASALTTLNRDLRNKEARDKISIVSLYGGLALANRKLGAVHGIAGPFGGMFDAPHGAVCTRLLPAVFQVNLQAIQERQPETPVLKRFERKQLYIR
jgi:alcohol dehydrogenase class IV